MIKSTLGLALYLALISIVIASDNRVDGQRPDAPDLSRPGDSAVGVRTIRLHHKNQIDAIRVEEGEALPRYDRPLTVEVWYPADTALNGGEYKDVYLRDGKTTVTLYGRAVRAAQPLASKEGYPVVVLSHGYPGNRYLMSHFGENLASKGYLVVALDHTDSTYRDAGAFASTLLNRALDQTFVLDEMARLNHRPGQFLHGLVDDGNAGLIGYSMGGYGAVISAGGGLNDGTFTELKDSHTQRAGWGWGVAFFDVDNDADLDIFAANGWITGKAKDDL